MSGTNPRLVTIVWTTTSNIVQSNKGNYNFNHFCPVFNKRDNFCTILDSHFEKVNNLKDHSFNPFKNTNNPCSFDSLENFKLKCSLAPVSKENKKSTIIKFLNVLDTIYDSQNFSNNHTEKIEPMVINDIKSNDSYTNNFEILITVILIILQKN